VKVESHEQYLWRQILCHVSLFYTTEALSLLERANIIFTTSREALAVRGPGIAIPTDIPFHVQPQSPYLVPFNGTHLSLWHPVEPPTELGWHGIPENSQHHLWYRHVSGTHIPAWNLFGNLFGLLTFQEERQLSTRDKHKRFIAGFSPRTKADLLEVPAFNDAVAALIGACTGIAQNGRASLHISEMLKPPVIVLSHDCDILHGNDWWTQGIRGFRIIAPLLNGKMPRVSNLWWIMRNAMRPKDFYFNNIPGMITLERMFGCTSTFYFLNGSGGRFGARSGSALLPELIDAVPNGWDMGMHYNYDTFLDTERFSNQRLKLSSILGYKPVAGRAHYLRFDPERSFSFLANQGIAVDESAGYSDRIGYRCGIGGCFQAYDPAAEKALSIWEIPMVIMDDTMLSQYGPGAITALKRLLQHLSQVGGALSVIFHPGAFHNPEFPEMHRLYHKMLIASRDLGCRAETALSLYNRIPIRFR
jgi:hypothetical protein